MFTNLRKIDCESVIELISLPCKVEFVIAAENNNNDRHPF